MLTLEAVFAVCTKLLTLKERKTPGGVLHTSSGDIPYKVAIYELERVREWLYPEFRTGDIQMVTRCKYCTHYKRYKKKDSVKPVYKYLCELDKVERPEDFFCKNGEKEEQPNG